MLFGGPIIVLITVLIILFILFKLFTELGKNQLKEFESSKPKIIAVVVEYRKEKNKTMRNDYSKLEYPYVMLENDESDGLVCLREANNWSRQFAVGEKLEVYWEDGILLFHRSLK